MAGGREPGISREAARCSVTAAPGNQLVMEATFIANNGNIYQVSLEK